MILSSMDELMRKRAQEILNRDKPVLEAQTNLDQQNKGVIPTVKNFLGLGDVLPEVKDAPKEYQDLRKSQLENKGFANSPFTKMIAGATTETYKDVALQPGIDEQNQKIIEQNNKLIDEISQKKKDHPEKADFYDKSIRNIQKNTQDLVSQIGGEIKDKTTGHLVGQSLSTGAELSQVIPIESLFSQGTKFLLKEGGEITGKEVAKLLAENGLKEGTEDAGKFLLEKGISPAKETLLKGEKLLSAKGITNIATNKSVVENVIYGGVFGAGGALEEKKSPMEVLGSTEAGMGLGFVAGSTLPGVISLVSRGLSKITKGVAGKFSGKVDKVAVEETAKDLEKAFGKTPNESDMAEIENAFAHGANRDEIVSHIKQAAEEPGVKVVPEPPIAEVPKEVPKVETPVQTPKTPVQPEVQQKVVEKPVVEAKPSPLIQEARKYKSADEFVNSQPVETKELAGAMGHRPTKTGATADNISQEVSDMGIPDFYEHPEWYHYGGKEYDESVSALMKIKNKPNAEITIYRASPKNELRTGDWVSLSKEKAKLESLSENVPVQKFKVKASEVEFAGDDITEFGYWGHSEKTKSQLTEIWKISQPLQEGGRGEILYHGGSKIDEVKLGKGNFSKTFYMSDDPNYAKSFGGKNSVVNKMELSPNANLADMRKPSDELINKIDEIASGTNTGKTLKIQRPDGSFVSVPETPKDSVSFHPYSKEQVIQGLRDGKANFAELPEVKKILKDLGYDGQITSEVPYAKNVGVWNKDVVKLSQPLQEGGVKIPRTENPSAIPTVEGTGKVKTRKASETLQRNLESQGIEGNKPEQYRQAVHSVRNPNADEFLKSNRELAKEVALGNAHVDGIIPEDVLAAVTRSGDKELIAEVATNTSLINDATEMGRRIEAWKQMNVDNPVRVISDITKDRVKSVGEKKIAKATEKLKVETKVKLKLETAQSLLDKLIC